MENLRQSVTNPPSLLIVDATDGDAGNQIYIKKKKEDFESLGWPVKVVRPHDSGELNHILVNEVPDYEFMNVTKWDCVIFQMPIGKNFQLNPENYLFPQIDCDGIGRNPLVLPATVRGILDYLDDVAHFEYEGKNAVVLGRSKIVGAPMAKALLDKNMTVTMCHSKTPVDDRNFYLNGTDLIVSAVGFPHLIKREEVGPDAIVIDVGINRVAGKLYGDFEENDSLRRSGWSTPVPGGVGLLTRLGLIKNCVDLKRLHT